MTLPFLTPLVPSVGISCLKSYLQKEGYKVTTVDGMTNNDLKRICYEYFDTLRSFIPVKQQGYYYNIALDVMLNHFMAYINKEKNPGYYEELIEQLIYNNFYVKANRDEIMQIDNITSLFYDELKKYVVHLIDKISPSILGFSIYKGTLAASVYTGRLVREIAPDMEILLGGTIFSQELFPGSPNFNRFLENESFFDKIFIGESEILFLEYLNKNLDAGKKVYTLSNIDNKLLDLDNVALPDYSDFDMSSYLMLPMFTSRGCIYKCSFCAETIYWKKYHKKTVHKVADDFENLSTKYSKNLFILTDCLINPLIDGLSETLTARKKQFYWDVYIKVDKNICDFSKVIKWRKAGFYRARLGIESGSQRLLDIIDKKITVEQIKQSIVNLANAGIKTTTYWISGHPDETEEDFSQTLMLLEELQDYIFEAECDPFRYFHTGQVNAKDWLEKNNNYHLYPNYATDMLLMQTYCLNTSPSREEIYERNFRFKEKCVSLGIPNPYSIGEIIDADKRWKELHKNSVPSIMELNNKVPLAMEEEQIQGLSKAVNTGEFESDFNFG